MQKSIVWSGVLVSFLFWLAGISTYAQTAGLDESVILFAEVKETPPTIKLRWYLTIPCTGFNMYRKLKSGTSFSLIAQNIPSTAKNWVDSSVQTGVEYEYKIVRIGGVSPWTSRDGVGYISSGIRIDRSDFRGKIILITDTTLEANTSLRTPLWQWKQDAAGDGWEVIPMTVTLTETPQQIKQRILNLNAIHQNSIRSVFILGHVAIPYSGQINPDGHGDHIGAWPADGYYGELDDSWTDASVNTTSATDARNRNVPGDGKFDQSTFPGTVDLEVGRVDIRNLPMYNMTEAAQIRRYLAKNHKFKTHLIKVMDRAMHDDQSTGLNFGATAWRSFTSLCRSTDIPSGSYANVGTGNFRTSLIQNDYLWSGSWGPGSYFSVGSNQNLAFVTDSFRTVFTSFIGSYFGDWDSPANNFMRAALSNKGPILTTCWSGRPFWYFHHMGMGESIGYCARLTMNNSSLYEPGTRARQVHISLLGDPTLRLHPMGQVRNLQASVQNNKVSLSWKPPSDSLLGYTILKKEPGQARFVRLHAAMATDTFFVDSCLVSGQNIYMVKATRLEGSRTGTYWNHSIGVMDTLVIQGLPIPSVQLAPLSGSFCQIDTVVIHSLIQNAGTSPACQWFKNDTLLVGATQDSIQIVHPKNNDTYRICVISGLACMNQDTAISNVETLEVNHTVTPSVALSSDVTNDGICAGTTAHFYALGTGKGHNPQYSWYVNQALIQNQDDSTYTTNTLADLDTIVVKLTSSADCANPVSVVSPGVVAHILPNPMAGFLVNQSQLTAQNPGNHQFQWLLNGSAIPGATDSTFMVLVDGNYSVVVTNGFQCSDTSQTQYVSVLGMSQSRESMAIYLFPNPFHETLYLAWEDEAKPDIVEISDIIGRKFFRRFQPDLIPTHGLKIKTNDWPSGNYIFQLQTQNRAFRKIISHQ